MFTAEQIMAAHAQVKSGADFPSYIQAIKAMGVTHYEAYVTDGHTDYHGTNNHTATVPAKYAPVAIAPQYDEDGFTAILKAHQQGKTDYRTFIADCARMGVHKWQVSLEQMTCTYYNSAGQPVLVEAIPH